MKVRLCLQKKHNLHKRLMVDQRKLKNNNQL